MISYSNKMANRNIGYTGKEEMQAQIKFNLNNGKDASSQSPIAQRQMQNAKNLQFPGQAKGLISPSVN